MAIVRYFPVSASPLNPAPVAASSPSDAPQASPDRGMAAGTVAALASDLSRVARSLMSAATRADAGACRHYLRAASEIVFDLEELLASGEEVVSDTQADDVNGGAGSAMGSAPSLVRGEK